MEMIHETSKVTYKNCQLTDQQLGMLKEAHTTLRQEKTTTDAALLEEQSKLEEERRALADKEAELETLRSDRDALQARADTLHEEQQRASACVCWRSLLARGRLPSHTTGAAAPTILQGPPGKAEVDCRAGRAH